MKKFIITQSALDRIKLRAAKLPLLNNSIRKGVSVLNTLKEAWYLGKISKLDFYKKAAFHRKGEIDTNNNFTFKADCYNIPISLLNL